MAFSIAVLAALVAVASAGGAPAARYPAGVSPAECPNFPFCHDGLHGNHAVGTYRSAAHLPAAVAAAPYYGAPGYWGYGAPLAYSAYAAPAAVAVAAPVGVAARYPAGVSPAECPNFPYCHDGLHGNHAVGALARAAVAHGHGYARQYPAGVNPAACPNYPYCH